jgi:uncharacterized protein YhbP (UPF0306 family)
VSSFRKSSSEPDPSSVAQLRRDLLDYLAGHNVMTIASCDGNVPWAAAVFYASDEFDLYFFSNPKSRHGGNMAANALVSAAIHEDYSDWRAIRGIQLEGRAERLRSLKLQARFWEVYLGKFPFVKQFFSGRGPGEGGTSGVRGLLQTKVTGVRLYRVVPRTLYYIDNSKGFGHRERLDLDR